MNNWLDLPKQKQIDLFNQLSAITGIQPQAIEKDAWVTLILRMIFSSEIEFYVNTVIPEKTFLEKLILLHEEFQKPKEKVRYKKNVETFI